MPTRMGPILRPRQAPPTLPTRSFPEHVCVRRGRGNENGCGHGHDGDHEDARVDDREDDREDAREDARGGDDVDVRDGEAVAVCTSSTRRWRQSKAPRPLRELT